MCVQSKASRRVLLLDGLAAGCVLSRAKMSDAVRFHGFPVAGINPMSAATARSFPRHTHDQYGIGVVDSGGHASWSGRGQVEAGPGYCISVNPGEVHDGRGVGRQARSWRILYLEPAVMDAARTDIFEGRRTSFTFDAPVFKDVALRGLFDAAFGFAASAKPSDRMACETAILKLIARLGAHSTLPMRHDEPRETCIRRARNRIDDDPAAALTLLDLAGEAGLSRFQLIRAFARELGLTPHAYILQRRLALARQLILKGNSLAEVAAAAGFYDQSHLTRCFSRQFGVTPRGYAHHARSPARTFIQDVQRRAAPDCPHEPDPPLPRRRNADRPGDHQ